MKYFLNMVAFVCTIMLLLVPAFAEKATDGSARDYETELFVAIERWDELEQQYDEQLTAQQRFVARYKFTDAIQNAREGNFAMIDAIGKCASLDDFIALINNGVISPNNPCVPEDEIIEYVYGIMEAAGYERPELIFVLHLDSGIRGDAWYVDCGHFETRTYENGDEEVEPFVSYKLVLEGEDHRLALFAKTDIIDDDVISIQY